MFIIAMIIFTLLPSGLVLAQAPTATLDVRLSTTTPVIGSGDWAVIKVDYSCSSIYNTTCNDVVVSVPIPPELSQLVQDVQVLDLSGDTDATYSPTTATWTFSDDIAPGSAGTFTLMVRFPKGATPDGATATLRASAISTSAPPVTSKPLTLTATAEPRTRADKRFVSGGVLDINTVYRVEVCVPGTIGAVDVTNLVIRDTLPAGATFVSATGGGVYNAGTNTITWPNENILVSAGESCVGYNVTVQFPDADFNVGDEIRNDMQADVTYVNGATAFLSDFDVRLIQPPTPNPGFSKNGPTSASLGDIVTYTFTSTNAGTSPLDAGHTFTDPIPAELEVIRITAGTNSHAPTIRLQIEYQVDGTTWNMVPGSPFTGTACVDIGSGSCGASITLGVGERITSLRYTYLDALPYGFSASNSGFTAEVISSPINQIIVNTADARFSYNGYEILRPSERRTRVVDNTIPGARPSLNKAVTPLTVESGETVTYTLTLSNSTVNATPLINPQISDLLLNELLYVPGSQTIISAPSGMPAPTFELIPNYSTTGRTLLNWSWDSYSLPPGEDIEIEFQAQIAPYTPAQSLSNTAYLAGWDNQPGDIWIDSCSNSSPDTYDFDNDGDTQEEICSSTISSVTLAAAAKSGSHKLVMGQLDTKWTYDPEFGYTVPGGSATYQLTITNTGTIPIGEITLLDILPWVGDVGVRSFEQARGTEWRPFLSEPIAVPSGASVFYSTQNNPCRAPDLSVDPTDDSPGCEAPVWSSTLPGDITTVQSFKVEFGDLILMPEESVTLTVYMQAPYSDPASPPDPNLIAWNSFGYRARAINSTEYLLSSDPPRVGIKRSASEPPGYGNYVWLDNDKDGIQDAGEPGINGARVDLFRDDDGVPGPSAGDTFIGTKITGPDDVGNPGYYLFSESFDVSDPRYPGYLEPGNYYAQFTPPLGYGRTAANQGGNDALDSDANQTTGLTAVTTLDLGEFDMTWDAGVTASTAVGNYVWIDRNANGLQDEAPGDGVNGVTVRLYTSGGSLVGTTTTHNDPFGQPGYYVFDNLTPGSYYVEFVAPSGFTFTDQNSGDDAADSDADTSTGRTATFTLVANQYDPNWDAGLIMPTGTLQLGNLVWRDLDNNGRYDPSAGETGINGATVSLYRDSNNDGVPDPSEHVGTTTTSTRLGQPGWYQFSNLEAGDYIAVLEASNFAFDGALRDLRTSTGNDPAPDPDDDIDHDDNGSVQADRIISQPITLSTYSEPDMVEDGDDRNGNQTLDFGLIGGSALGNLVWFDTDNDGTQNNGELGVAGITVELLDASNNVLKTTTTNADGIYGFADLAPGNYRVRFSNLPSGHTFTSLNSGSDTGIDSDADPGTGTTPLIILGLNQTDLRWDAGLVADLASLGNRVWDDLNRDGIQDAGEVGVNGVTVSLYRADDSFVTNTVTANDGTEDGIYRFNNLPPGDYYVVFSNLPAGYASSPINIGTDDTIDSDSDRVTGRTAITTLTPGENDPTWDMGIFTYASIGDRVWNDYNRNGIQDGGESGVPNVTVRLYQPGSHIPLATTTTNSSGNYSFTGLIPDLQYYVEFVMPSGYKPTIQDVSGNSLNDTDSDASPLTFQTVPTELSALENDVSWDFGIYQTASIGNLAWLDLNANGVQDANETNGVPGVQVILYDQLGNDIDSTVTNTSGIYNFSGLEPGIYSLGFILPDTFILSPQDANGNTVDTADSDAAPGPGPIFTTIQTELIPGENDPTWDIGLFQPSSLGDRVWHDVNANGVQDPGETGVSGVQVSLYRPGPDGVIGGGDDVLVGTPTTTDASGNYRFNNLAPGTYYVLFGPTPGYTNVSPANSPNGDSDTNSDANPATRMTPLITLPSSTSDMSWDMGVYNTAALGDYVWVDTDADGIQDEPASNGVNGVTVSLYTINGMFVTSDTTENDGLGNPGYYFFPDLTPGNYYVVVSNIPADHVFTQRDQGSDNALDSDVLQVITGTGQITGVSSMITLNSGQTDRTWDAGIFPVISVGDRVWLDANANGIQDPEERVWTDVNGNTLVDVGETSNGVPGVRVELYNGSGTLVDVTYTNLDGNYLFEGLFPGTYRVVFSDIPTGYQRSPEDRGADDAADSDANSSYTIPNFPLSATDLTRDMGLYQLASIGDYVWHDINANGIQEVSEPPIANVNVRLVGTDGTGAAVDLTTTTDTNGAYRFQNLVPGTYHVEFTMPTGYDRASGNDQGANDGLDSDIDPVTLRTPDTELRSGENDLTWDAGFYSSLRLGNLVWHDLNNNGLADDGATGIANVEVLLTGTDGLGNAVNRNTTTDSNGLYLFDNLMPGEYVVTIAASNFTGAGALASSGNLPAYVSSSGTNGSLSGPYEPAADPDNNTDNNDNGSLSGGAVVAQSITLRSQDEPLAGVDTDDHNGNLTVDFGFFRPLSLGNLVWNDLNNNKIFDSGTESGISGVTVQLYRDTDGNNAYTAGTDTLITSTTTDGNGNYLFDNLVAGNYVVVIPATNFGTGGALQYFRSSDGSAATDSATDPDTGDTDNDDNGIGPSNGIATGLVSSGAVTLSLNGEPITDGDTNSNSNLTVDFGFYSLSVGNLVWSDADNDGIKDVAESGINSRPVNLYYDANGNGTIDAGAESTAVATINTNNGGRYFFGGLRSGGNYEIRVTTAGAGWVSSTGGANGVNSGTYEPGLDPDSDATDNNDNGTQFPSNIVRSPVFQVNVGTAPTDESDTTLPTGVTDRAANNSSNLSIDFGLFNHARMGDLVWIDTNGNGVRDGGEIGVAGVTVRLYDNSNNLIATTTTNASGIYGFSYLNPGTYYVVFDPTTIGANYAISPLNAGGDDTLDSDANQTTGQTGTFTLNYNSNDTTWDMGIYPRVSLGNLIWDDLNNNGLADGGEPGIPNVQVDLYRDTNGNGTYDAGTDTFVTTQDTNASGNYLFTQLEQGNYLVVIPASEFASGGPLYRYRSSTGQNGLGVNVYEPAPDPDDGVGAPTYNNINNDDNGTDHGDGYTFTRAITLNPSYEPTNDGDTDSNTNLTLDLGFFQNLNLGNLVWEDTNNNGIYDGGEPLLDNVVVQLYMDDGDGSYDAGDSLINTTTTDASGIYNFDDLIPGNYIVVLPASNFNAGGRLEATGGLAAYRSSTGVNGVATGPYEGGGIADPDNDLDNRDDGTTISGAVASLPITLARDSEPDVGVDGDGLNGNQTVDFGLFRPASLGDRVWNDLNANGIQDAGEVGIGSVTVRLLDGANNPVLDGVGVPITTTTDGSGNYRFDNLNPGIYSVSFDKPSGYISTLVDQGADPAADSDANRNTGVATGITTLVEGQHDPNWDAGFYRPISIGNQVWYDTNNDGAIDGSEVGINGVRVELFYDANNDGNISGAETTPVAITTTAGNGTYLFTTRNNTNSELLNPGTYVVGIPASQFEPVAGVLRGYYNSLVTVTNAGVLTETAPSDPDISASDLDDNGQHQTSGFYNGGVLSLPVTIQAGLEPTSENPDVDSNTPERPDASDNQTVDFGFYTVSVGNIVWDDNGAGGVGTLADGIRNGTEPGLSGVRVRLYAQNGTTEILVGPDGLLGTSDDATGGMLTDGNGNYSFGRLPQGSYRVQIELPTGFVSTLDTAQSATPSNNTDDDDNGIGSDQTATTVMSNAFTLAPGNEPTVTNSTGSTNDPTIDFGVVRYYSLGNRVWEDLDNDGILNNGELGLDGVVVRLYMADGTTRASHITGVQVADQITAGGGYYRFDNLPAGDYIVEVMASNFTGTNPLRGYFSSTGAGQEADPDINDGDNNDNGLDTPVAGATRSAAVTLGEGSGTTEPSGDNDPATNPLNSSEAPDSQSNRTVDFGFVPVYSLGNRVWHDTNNNGAIDGGEPGINGVIVRLYQADGTTRATDITGTQVADQTTAGGGYYRFDNLPAGNYVVEIMASNFAGSAVLETYTSSSGAEAVSDVDNNDNGLDTMVAGAIQSGVVTLGGSTEPITDNDPVTNPEAGESRNDRSNRTVDFGFYQPVSIGNRVWYDTNNNGSFDAGEDGIGGVRVELFFDADNDGNISGAETTPVAVTTTVGDGTYLFTQLTDASGNALATPQLLRPGTYAVGIPASELSGSLRGLFSSGTTAGVNGARSETAPADPDGSPDVDGDDNGQLQTSGFYTGGVLSLPLTVEALNEPITENPDSDPNPSYRPDSSDNQTVDFGFYGMSLGNLVWLDDGNGGGTANDGIRNGTEAAIAGVAVRLLANDGTVLQTTTTDANGRYLFTGLAEGAYIVEVDIPNGLQSSRDPATSGTPSSDDNDDNGVIVTATTVRSNAVLLDAGAAPTGESDQGVTTGAGMGDPAQTDNPTTPDGNSNLHVDFGFVPQDWGDLPDPSYPTLAANNGPRHGLTTGLQIGATIDTETDGQPSAAADGDGADEDGVTFPTFYTGLPANVTVHVTNTTGRPATLSGFIDFDGDGVLEASEMVTLPIPNGTTGNQTLTFNVPNDAMVSSQVGARFRLSTDASLTATGPASDGEVEDYLINITPTYSLGNRVWHDTNNNGVMDAGESGITGVTVRLYVGNSSTVATQITGLPLFDRVTDANGYYRFDNLAAGDYSVEIVAANFGSGGTLETYISSSGAGEETNPNNDVDYNDNGLEGIAPIATAIRSGTVTLGGTEPTGETDPATNPESGEAVDSRSNRTVDFGFYQPVSIGNRVWYDTNNNGSFDAGEDGIGGVRVELFFDADNDGNISGAETTPVAVTTTVGDGTYLFTQLTDASGNALATPQLLSPGTYVVGIPASELSGSLRGLFSSGTTAGTDGARSETAPADPDGTPDVDGDDNGQLQTSGFYTGGVLSLPVTVEALNEPITENPDSDPNPSYRPDNSDNQTVDFGFYGMSLGNLVWLDDGNGGGTANDGIRNGTEAAIAGVAVRLLANDGTVLQTTTTDANGRYLFTGLAEGAYIVEVDIPNGLQSSRDPATSGTPSSDDNDDNGVLVTATTVRSVVITLDAGAAPTGESDQGVTTGAGMGNPVQTDNPKTPDGNSNLHVDFGFVPQDWGDLPDPSYPTLAANNGPRHGLTTGLQIGATIDTETDGQPSAAADGDGADEDGVTFPTFYTGLPADVTVHVTNTTGRPATLSGFIDFDGDGVLEVSEMVTLPIPNGTTGNQTLTFNVPNDAMVSSQVGARFRLSTDASLTATGPASDGEVEDYLINVTPTYSLGNRVWHDRDNSGDINAADGVNPGVTGVTVRLLTSAGTAVTDATGATVGTVTTDADGYYRFDRLLAGDYVVEIVDTNFAGVLNNYISSSGINEEGNPNDDGDSNDNGLDTMVAGAIRSGTVTLGGTEPSGDNDPATNPEAGEAVDSRSNRTVDFGFYLPASLGDFVWDDLNGNGVQDGGEPGVENVTVTLTYAGPNGTFGDADDTTSTKQTDNNGAYLFSDLAPGNYRVSFSNLPSGYDFSVPDNATGATADEVDSDVNPATGSTPDINLSSGENDLTWDAGINEIMSLGDRVWNDANGNGIQDVGELGVANVTVTLYNATTNAVVGTPQTTDTDGNYLFAGVPPGEYYIIFSNLPSGYDFSPTGQGTAGTDSNADPTTGRTGTITMVSGQTDDLTWDAGIYQLLSLGNLVWEDLNNNGSFDSGTESGLGGVTIELYRDDNGDGVGDTLVGTSTTDSNGVYQFTDLPQGDYVVVIPASNFTGPLSGFLSSTGTTHLTAGPNEPGISTETNTDNDDNGSLVSGDVVASVVYLRAGDEPDTGVDGDGRSGNQTVDFGFIRPTGFGDRVWEDVNGNGVQNGGEVGVPGVTVTLYNATTNAPVGTPQTTDTSGNYLFTNLAPGDYYVVFSDLPSGYGFSPTGQGDVDTDSNADPATGNSGTISLKSGAPNDLDWDAGIYQLLSLGNLVWNDLNNNGSFDSGTESGIDGVTVQLYRDTDNSGAYNLGDTLVDTYITSGGGLYQFTDLPQGNYVVVIPASNFTGPLSNFLSSTGTTNLTAGPSEPGANPENNADHDDNGTATGGAVASSVVQLRAAAEPDTGVDGDGTSANQTVDFGFFQPASVGNLVWNDVNGNGEQESGETGRDGVEVRLYRSDGTPVGTTTTSGGGIYTFSDLPPGDYYVEFGIPSGYGFSPTGGGTTDTDSNANPANGRSSTFNLEGGENDLTWDAGIYQLLSLGNLVWNDLNNNGIVDGTESGIGGVIIELYRDDTGDGVGDTLVGTSTTGSNGQYQFTDLPQGDYVVVIPASNFGGVLNGYLSSTGTTNATAGPNEPGADPENNTDNDDNGGLVSGDVVTSVVRLRADAEPDTDGDGRSGNQTVDFGFFLPASIGDRVWNDLNANGVQDGGEVGVDGVTVTLYSSDGTPVASMNTSGGGAYSFTGLAPGDYYIVFSNLPTDYIFSPVGQGTSATNSDADRNTGRTSTTSLSSGENDPDWDGGIYWPASLGNYVWDDADANGIQDAGEGGVENVTVRLIQNGNVVATTQTDSNGYYEFTELGSGDYLIEIDRPFNWQVSPQYQGGSASDNDIDRDTLRSGSVTLNPGDNNPDLDIGLYRLASVGNRVWEDFNKDGIFDSGSEEGVRDIPVYLYREGETTPIRSAVTDANGNFRFDELEPGNYYIRFAPPTGWVISQPNQGSDDGADSDADSNNGSTVVFTLNIGTEDMTWWMGISRPPTSISLLDFSVERQSEGNLLRWETGSELKSSGFEIYRSATGNRADAVQVSQMILARGTSGGGASYEWLDRSASAGVGYHYWLVEVEISGQRNEYHLEQQPQVQEWRVYLPLVVQ
ncbi:conserved repeat domain protein [Oscillochloris trichoides DG-6]|uniref:Conserved repeat domain protein n=1 Tax=Oscillochloris trichoides DG-6 TaxID=765420 RepID=E1IG96_9CHLR|nr:conserved repeat domain protein [Oscillochloris trichoides DG-6]